MHITALATGMLAPFFLELSPEVRSTYISLGKIMEDRPMQVTLVRAGYDAGAFGRFGIRNWDVSSLTGRRSDEHRHALYHTEFGPTWQYDLKFTDDWRFANDLTRSWTMYRGFKADASNRTYRWWQIEQALENPYVVPFWRLRRCFRGSDYFYFKAGIRRSFPVYEGISVVPSVFTEGGSSRCQRRVLGQRLDGGTWYDGASSVSLRLELRMRVCDCLTAFAYVEQYEVVGGEARRNIDERPFRCAHSDWTHGGIGIRARF